MAVDAVLLESPTMRATVADRVEALDRVRALELLPDGVHVTTEGVAAYFGVSLKAIYSLVVDHRSELAANGYVVVAGARLASFKEVSGIRSRARSLALFTRRAVLNVAMLLRDSETARQVRCHLLDAEQAARRTAVENAALPVDNAPRWPEGSLQAAVAGVAEHVVRDVVGTAVVPLLNALAVEVGRNSSKIDAMADRVDRLERVVLDDGERAVARRRRLLLQAVEEGADGDELAVLLS
ncbi:restriction endonuclease [Kitasatospora sp. DSM 101779]|uniref:restriction endonuclease n=1 Tax=Kitasatospora sp. DSM 101779 TaxID=2853165 RepID=UPI0021DAC6E8|nr:restriction endonuclease [Kitasatospora sp. DSM 101779]MCU7823682.1 restriction endonuclease [Kitasatospora sp. DSM 101779]